MARAATAARIESREDWLLDRQQGIGGSDIAAIAGMNPWKSPMGVYLEKIGQVEDAEPSEAAHWGVVLEDVVAQEFKRRTGWYVERCNRLLAHPEHPWMLASLDRKYRDPDTGLWGVLECKTTSAWKRDEWADETVPPQYLVQVQWYLGVTGYEQGYLAVLIGGQQYQQIEVERDEEMIAHLITIGGDFWRLVESRTPPAVDGSEACTEVMKRLYPDAEPDSITILPPTARALIVEYQDAGARLKVATTERDHYANELRALLTDYEAGVFPGEDKPAVTWKTQTSHRLDTKRLQTERPDVAAQYMTETRSRVLRVKGA